MLPNLQITSFYPSTKEKKNPTCFFALTNHLHLHPDTACFMTAIKVEMGRDSKQWGPDSTEWNPCQDYLQVVQMIRQIPVSLQGFFFINMMEEERQLGNLSCATKLQEERYEAERRS